MTGRASDTEAITDRRAANTQRFYTQWAKLYDAIASYTPGIHGLRRRAVASLDLSPGDTVVEFGCGTGANFPFLREAVGPSGTVVGVDFTPGMVTRASERASHWENVHVVRGDATKPPLFAAGSVDRPDGIYTSFLSGMLDDPAGAVATWKSLLADDGRICLLDLARSTGLGRPLNPIFAQIVRASTPPGGDVSTATLAASLDERVAAAHRAVLTGDDATHETAMGGFVRLSAGTR